MEKNIKIVTSIAVIVNTFLAALKVIIGFLFNSMAVLADGIDSATDILTASIVYFATRLSSKPPDKLHPYGHRKIENIGAKIISFIVFYAGISLLIESIKRLVTHNYNLIQGIVPITVTLISVIFKTFLFIIEFRIGKKYNRPSLIAEALNMRNDILLSSIVFFGILLNKLGFSFMDPLVGMIMSVIIIKVAFEIFNENAVALLDGIKKDEEWIYDEIITLCNECEGVKNPHKIRIRKIGECFDIDMDIEVDPKINVQKSHELTLCIKDKIRKLLNDKVYDVVIHVEPYRNVENEPYGIGGENEK